MTVAQMTMTAKALTIDQIKVDSTTNAFKAMASVDAAIEKVSTYRATLGAAQNRLEHTVNNLKVTSENITSAESRIRDTDMADEITAYTKNNILLQAAQSMLFPVQRYASGCIKYAAVILKLILHLLGDLLCADPLFLNMS